MKAHVGCGLIYLTDGWINVDLPDSGSKLAADFPKYARERGTTEEMYYARIPTETRLAVLNNAPVDHAHAVCDAYGSWSDLPFEAGSVSVIYSVQTFEHLSISEAHVALVEANRVLCKGGLLRLDVPDMDETLRLYRETGNDFFKRHILGSRKNQYAYHCMGWTRDGLIGCCERFGFEYVCSEQNIHFYPSIALRFRKVSP